MIGRKVRSVKIARSPPWLAIQAICSGNRRGFRVWHTAPMPMMPYQASMWRAVFQARVPTRSPGLIPRASSAFDTRLARSRIPP